jgi:hypothetical protein
LRVVETAGDFLAVARHERDRGAAVEQGDRRLDLLLANTELFCDLSIDIYHATSLRTGRGGMMAAGRRLWTSTDRFINPASQRN